jgi:hypothetical protein
MGKTERTRWCSLAKSLLSLLGWLSTPSMVVLTGNLAVDLSLTGTSHWHSSAKNSILATRNKDIFCGCQDQQLPIKSTELISINRPYRQSRSEATNTHTHTRTHTHTHTKVQHRREKQPKSSLLATRFYSPQPVKTRSQTHQPTSNQNPKPQIKLPRVCPGFPRREKRIRDPQHFTSHITASLQSPLQDIQHGLRTIESATSLFENATRNRLIFRC